MSDTSDLEFREPPSTRFFLMMIAQEEFAILDYMVMHWDDIEELKALVDKDYKMGTALPSDVASAMNILRHEKIGRWESSSWVWAVAPETIPQPYREAWGQLLPRRPEPLMAATWSAAWLLPTVTAVRARSTGYVRSKILRERTDEEGDEDDWANALGPDELDVYLRAWRHLYPAHLPLITTLVLTGLRWDEATALI